ncbi:uncharacterized protein FIBRA_05392 [Fibroporia radiculosa]|uniref:Uncharacterized protein n=1 Tax=Fibroporia radiculosa TaxID=599839 RepID=J4GQX2_9APHY|nr:uncharacterized protein FIBRA_05392 [Fibroporia radiculosa]CCM03265.1 predicted protein [Fibroporia radiculosa]
MTLPGLSSPPPSPLRSPFSLASSTSSSSSAKRALMPLNFAGVANIFIRMRRHRLKAMRPLLEFTSGDWPFTHPGLDTPGAVSPRRIPLIQEDTFDCRDGVDVAKLLRLVRATLYEDAQAFGATVLVSEQCVSVSPSASYVFLSVGAADRRCTDGPAQFAGRATTGGRSECISATQHTLRAQTDQTLKSPSPSTKRGASPAL